MPSIFQSLTAFFNPPPQSVSTASSSRRTQALSYTHDAFSLPTHSPSLQLDQDSHSSTPFTYPPSTPTGGPQEYTPFSSSDRLNRGHGPSILPLHTSSLSPSPLYPPLAQTWARLRTWLSNEYPELGDTLNYGILPAALAEVEMSLGFQLPQAVRESYLIVDGQEAESSAGCSDGLFFGLSLLPLEDVLEEWRFWRDVDDDPATGANSQLRSVMQSIPNGWIRREYSCRGWLPLIADRAGNYVGVDMSPAEGGAVGQVIVFGRDFDTKIVLWRGESEGGWGRWLASFVEELENGEGFELSNADPGSDDSQDSVGYESYFFTGATGGQGGDGGGSGGLKLSGEYKGWSVIEAWADKSYKRWYTAGLVPQADDELEDQDHPVGLGLPATDSGLGTELAATGSSSSSRPPNPIINITVPPVSAILKNDIPSPFSSRPSSPSPLRDPLPILSPTSRTSPNNTKDNTLVSLQQTPPLPTSWEQSVSSLQHASSSDEPPRMMSPIQPTPSPTPSKPSSVPPNTAPSASSPPPAIDGTDIVTPTREETAPAPVPSVAELAIDPSEDPPVEVEATIRVVGGGNYTSGVSKEEPIEDEDILNGGETTETESIVDANGVSKQVKKKGFGLKKLGGLGGKKKKDAL